MSDARGRLAEERERLEGIRQGLVDQGLTEDPTEDALSDYSSLEHHQADAATEVHDRERDLSILERVEAELNDVEHALRRLDDGTYGSCEACGKPIDPSRLEAMPAARFCVDDQAEAERESRLTTALEDEGAGGA